MKDENKEFYDIDNTLTPEQVDMQLEALDELVEAIMLEKIKHMTQKEKLDAAKYRASAAGRKAIAKYVKKRERAGYKVNKALSKKMKQVAKFRNEDMDVDLVMDYLLDNLNESEINTILAIDENNITEEQQSVLNGAIELCNEACSKEKSDEEVMDDMSIDDIADIDDMVEQIMKFCEADDTEVPNVDPDTGEELTEFKHMSSLAKAKAKKWRKSAAGKKSLAKSLKKRSRAGYKPDAKRSKIAKQVSKFRNESEETFDSFDEDFLRIVLDAENILKEYEEDGIDIQALREACKSKNESDEVTIVIPLADEDAISAAADETDVIIVSKDAEQEACFVKGTVENLRAFLDKLGYEDSVNDLIVEERKICKCRDIDDMDSEHDDMDDDDDDDDDDDNDDEYDDMDDMDEAFKRKSTAERIAQRKAYKKNKNKLSYKMARARYARKSSRAGYKVDKTRSREMAKIAKTRVESIENLLDESFKSSPVFGSLNEAQTNEMKAMFTDAISKTLMESYSAIEKDVREGYEEYINKGLLPSVLEYFDNYKDAIAIDLYEWADEYLRYVAEEFVEENKNKKMFIKSSKSENLESFSEKLLNLIKEELKVYPEQEDALQSAKDSISSLSNELKEARISLTRERNKALESEKNAHLYEKLQESTASDSSKDEIIEYAKSNLFESNVSLFDFKKKVNSMIEEAANKPEQPKKTIENKVNEDEEFDFMKMFNRR